MRVIRPLVNAALDWLSGKSNAIYSAVGRESSAPEELLRALLIQAFFGVRSERQLLEQLRYTMMFRWFVGLSLDAPVWDVSVFTKNRKRLLEGDIARRFLAAILVDEAVAPLLCTEHFSVDGTLIEAWASMKSFQPRMVLARRRPTGAIARSIFAARPAAMRRMPPRPTLTRASMRKRQARPPGFAPWAMRSAKTAMAWWWTRHWRRPPARRSASRLRHGG